MRGKVRAVKDSIAPKSLKRQPSKSIASPAIDHAMEKEVGITVDDLAAIYALDSIKGFGPQTFKELNKRGLRPADILHNPRDFRLAGKRGAGLRAQLLTLSGKMLLREHHPRAARQIAAA